MGNAEYMGHIRRSTMLMKPIHLLLIAAAIATDEAYLDSMIDEPSHDVGASAGRRGGGGAGLSTSGSFVMAANRAGNDEEEFGEADAPPPPADENPCPPTAQTDAINKMNFSAFASLLAAGRPDSAGCSSKMLFNSCDPPSQLQSMHPAYRNPKNLWSNPSQRATESMFKQLCGACNSVEFTGLHRNGSYGGESANDGIAFAVKSNIHRNIPKACKADGSNQMCQIKVCNLSRNPTVSHSHKDELFLYGVKLESALGGLPGDSTYNFQHVRFKVMCGKMEKLSVCVAVKKELWPTGQVCHTKKICSLASKVAIRAMYVRQTHAGSTVKKKHLGWGYAAKFTGWNTTISTELGTAQLLSIWRRRRRTRREEEENATAQLLSIWKGHSSQYAGLVESMINRQCNMDCSIF